MARNEYSTNYIELISGPRGQFHFGSEAKWLYKPAGVPEGGIHFSERSLALVAAILHAIYEIRHASFMYEVVRGIRLRTDIMSDTWEPKGIARVAGCPLWTDGMFVVTHAN